MKRRAIIVISVGVLVVILATAIHLRQEKGKINAQNVKFIHNQGDTQGTTYSITYQQPEGIDLQPKIEQLLHEFDLSLSTYIPNSVISRINRNDSTVKTDSNFETMFYTAQNASKHTNGALDITVGPLVKAWGFAFGNSDHSKLPKVSDFLSYVGFNKIRIVNHKLIKDDPRILIDPNSVAQGQSVDLVAKLLEKNNCRNYMVEIGGEIACKGFNPDGKKWRIGIDKPIDDPSNTNNELQTIVELTDCGITTAGDYRKYYIEGGKKYSHIINPHTGYPVDNNLLSVTIIAPNALTADAYDTPLMVLGVDSALKICKRIPGMECYLIYKDKDGKHKVVYSEGFKKYLSK